MENIVNRSFNDYVILYKKEDLSFRIYDNYDDSYSNGEYPKERRTYHLAMGYYKKQKDSYDGLDEAMKEYADDFYKFSNQLKKATYNPKTGKSLIDYSTTYSQLAMVVRVFNYFCGRKYKCHESIDATEWKWMEWANSSALMHLTPEAHKKTIDSYGYDENKFYCRVLGSDYMIPRNRGSEEKLTAIYEKLRWGYYRVKITCDNPEFRKIFKYSEHDVYWKTQVELARKHQKEFDIDIELIVDGEPNAYLYLDRNMIKLSSVTKEWFEYLMKLNKTIDEDGNELKRNPLLKMLCSTAWSTMNETNTMNKTEEEIINENIDVGDAENDHEYDIIEQVISKKKSYYVLRHNFQPYKYNIRLKPLISAYGREIMAELAYPHLDKLFRIHTDGIVFTEPVEFKHSEWGKTLWPEEKTTGEINWRHNGCYKKTTDKDYKSWKKDLKKRDLY